MPNVIVIAGPNGAGKSTLAPALLRDTLNIPEFVNADTIAEGLSAYSPESVSIESGRIRLARMRELAAKHSDFAFETTFASRLYAKMLKKLKSDGYLVHIVFLWLSSPELAIKRVALRVADGGHNIPVETVRRRYERGISNFFRTYRPLADSWQFLDNSGSEPVGVAYGAKISGKTIVDEVLWQKIKK